MSCWLCAGESAVRELRALDADGQGVAFVIDLCGQCGSGALRDPPRGEQLGRWYEDSYYGQGARKFLAPFQWVFDLGKAGIASRVHRCAGGQAGARALDLGCGTGQLLAAFESRGVTATGVERPGAARRAVRAGLDIREGELEDQDFEPGSFGIVTLWHVLEHLPDPAATLSRVRRLLGEGGLLAIAVPNQGSWQARWFGRHWFHLDVPRHQHFIDHDALCERLRQDGYTIVHESTVQWSQCLFGFAQSVLNLLLPARPNRLFSLMRRARGAAEYAELCAWLAIAGLLMPVAMVEAALSAIARRGATSTVLAIRA